MSEDVKFSPLVKAMEGGFLDDLKVFHMKDYKFVVPILQDTGHMYVSYIIHALRAYFDFTTSDAVEQERVETILSYLKDDDGDWEYYESRRASHLIHLLQVNDFYNGKKLSEDEEMRKEDWKTNTMGKWKLLHPLRTKEMQDQMKMRVMVDTVIEEEEPPREQARASTSSTCKRTRKGKPKPKPKSPN